MTPDTRHLTPAPCTLLHASSIFVFFCGGDSLLSRAIMRITGGPWSHCGIGFTTPQGEMYYEALFSKGFTGPRPLSDIYDWAAKNPERKLTVVRLGVEADLATEKLIISQAWVGVVGYAEWQLVAMWAFERFGRRFGWHVPRSSNTAICSVAVARILHPQIDLTDADHPQLDEVTPVSLYWALQRYLGMRHSNDAQCRTKSRLAQWLSSSKPRTMNPEPGTVLS